MNPDKTEDTLEHTTGESAPTGIARCDALDGQSEPYVTHGVAIGANEVTHGANGAKFWSSTVLRQAVQSLVGVPLTKNHDDDRVESVVGEVVDAAFEEGVGIVFEAEIDDEGLATKVARGRLEVSVHALHADGGRTSEGELIVEDVRFLDLSLVPRGGSPANYVEAGNSPSDALASLSADNVSEILSDADTSMTDDTDTIDEEEAALESDEESEETEAEVAADEADTEETEAEVGSDEADAEDVSETELRDDDAPSEDGEAEVEAGDVDEDLDEATLEEEIESLRAENQSLRNEVESVRLEYAETLCEDSPFDAETMASKLTFDELRDTFEEAEASLVSDTDASEVEATPAPQTGGGEGTLSTSDDDVDADEVASLESKIEKYDEMGWDAAKADAEDRLESVQS